jgi:hypothetical protein
MGNNCHLAGTDGSPVKIQKIVVRCVDSLPFVTNPLHLSEQIGKDGLDVGITETNGGDIAGFSYYGHTAKASIEFSAFLAAASLQTGSRTGFSVQLYNF